MHKIKFPNECNFYTRFAYESYDYLFVEAGCSVVCFLTLQGCQAVHTIDWPTLAVVSSNCLSQICIVVHAGDGDITVSFIGMKHSNGVTTCL